MLELDLPQAVPQGLSFFCFAQGKRLQRYLCLVGFCCFKSAVALVWRNGSYALFALERDLPSLFLRPGGGMFCIEDSRQSERNIVPCCLPILFCFGRLFFLNEVDQ